MYWLISTLIRYFRILCTNYTHSNRVEMLLPQKSFTTAAYWQRTHGTAAPRGCEARGWARGTESRRTDERWDILAELLPRQETLSWPARAAPAASFSLLHSPHHTTPPYSVWLYWLLPLLWLKVLTCEAIHRIKFRNIMRIEYVRVRAIIKIQNVVQDGTLKMKRICPVSGFSWEKSVYWATWRV